MLVPEFAAGESSSVRERTKLGPHDLLTDTVALVTRGDGKTAIDSGQDSLAANHLGPANNAVGNGLRVLDDVRGMIDDPRDHDLVFRQRNILKHAPLEFMAATCPHERIATDVGPKQDVDNSTKLGVAVMGTRIRA